jgi:hypothetical protein
MREWECDVDDRAIFEAVWPEDEGGSIIDEIVRTNRAVSVLRKERVPCIQEKCEMFALLLSWVMHIMGKHVEFIPRVIEVFGCSP